MRRMVLLPLVGVLLAMTTGCTPAVIAADEQGITLDTLPQIAMTNPTLAHHYDKRALEIADEHCRQYGRFARLMRRTADTIYFKCVQ